MGLDGKTRKGIQRVEGEIHKKTSVSNTRFRFKK